MRLLLSLTFALASALAHLTVSGWDACVVTLLDLVVLYVRED